MSVFYPIVAVGRALRDGLSRLRRLAASRLAPTGFNPSRSEFPISGRVYWRGSTDEWVLELNGQINDTAFSCRHPQPGFVPPEDVPGLPTLYARLPA